MKLLDVSVELDSIDPNISIKAQDESGLKEHLRQQEFQHLCELKLLLDTLLQAGDLLGKVSLLSAITQQFSHILRVYVYPRSGPYTYFYDLYHALSSVLEEISNEKGDTNED